MATRAIRIGLTGGIGSGKSTVASLLNQAGATQIDADAISRAATAPGGEAIATIATCFGPEFIDASGGVDRATMRHRIFSDSSSKFRLEAIIHPIVRQEIIRQTSLAEASQAPCIVFDIPLLVESGHWREILHRIIVVDCTHETQIARVTARNGMHPTEVRQIIARQATRAQRLQIADASIFNEAITIHELEQEVRKISHQFGL